MAAGIEEFTEKLKDATAKAAGKAGFDVGDRAMQRIAEYGDELRKWNKAYNLVGRKLGDEGIIDLYRDALTPLAIRGLFEGRKEVFDIGSGAGMPGIPLYLVAGPFPLTLVESQRKKITFLRHVCRKLELEETGVYAGRLEEMAKEEDQLNAYEVGLARAVMDPVRLIKLARPLLCDGGRIVLFVGKGDAEKIRRSTLILNEKGFELEGMRSTQRIMGKDNYLAVIRKSSR